MRKIFLGGLCPRTVEATLRDHFGKYGDMTDCCVIRDADKKSRCFGFVTFTKMAMVDDVMADFKECGGPMLDGKTIEIKRAIPRGVRQFNRLNPYSLARAILLLLTLTIGSF